MGVATRAAVGVVARGAGAGAAAGGGMSSGGGVGSLSDMGGKGRADAKDTLPSGSSVGVVVGVSGESNDLFFCERASILEIQMMCT